MVDHDPDPDHERELPSAALDDLVLPVVDGEDGDGNGEEDAKRRHDQCQDGQAVQGGVQGLCLKDVTSEWGLEIKSHELL